MGPRPWPVEDMPTDDIGIECLAFKERFWYPEVMSNESHWVPIAEDPLSYIGDQTLYDVRRLAIIFVIQANVETKHQIELLRVVQNRTLLKSMLERGVSDIERLKFVLCWIRLFPTLI